MTTQELPKGLRGHAGKVRRLRELFAQEGGSMTQDRFDQVINQEVKEILQGLREWPILDAWSGDDYIIHSFNGEGMWGEYLSLLQLMIHHKLASQSGKLPDVVYTIATHSKDSAP